MSLNELKKKGLRLYLNILRVHRDKLQPTMRAFGKKLIYI